MYYFFIFQYFNWYRNILLICLHFIIIILHVSCLTSLYTFRDINTIQHSQVRLHAVIMPYSQLFFFYRPSRCFVFLISHPFLPIEMNRDSIHFREFHKPSGFGQPQFKNIQYSCWKCPMPDLCSQLADSYGNASLVHIVFNT